MKIPIPDDWDGKTWDCFQVRWPASPQWLAVLAGLISQPNRLRATWDENTGNPYDLWPTTHEILNRNWPWRNCAGEKSPGSIEELHALGACYDLDWGDENMPCLDISKLLKVEGGVLYAKNDCCEWVAVGSVAGQTEDIGPTPLDTTGGQNPPTYSACGKAKAIVDFAYLIMEAGWAAKDELPWHYVRQVEQSVGYDLDNFYVVQLCSNLAVADVLGIVQEEVMDPFKRQDALCKIVDLFSNDAAGVPDSALYEQIKSIVSNEQWLYQELWRSVFDAMGRVDMDTVARLGATDTAADCGCPDPLSLLNYGPDASGWFLSPPLTVGTFSDTVAGAGASHVCFEGSPPHDVFGFAVKFAWTGTPGTIKMEGPSGSECYNAQTDVEATETSSHHYESSPEGTWWVFTRTSAIRSAVGAMLAQPFAGYDVTLYSSNPAAPSPFLAGALMQGAITASGDAGGHTLEISEVRWLHNTNSPT